MEKRDEELLHTLVASNEELAGYWTEHQELERHLNEMNRRVRLSAEEELERKELQKRKLAGMDQIMSILAQHRA